MSDTVVDLPDRDWLTVEEVAAWLRISRNSCYDAVHDGDIPSVRLGRSIRIPRAALLRDFLGFDLPEPPARDAGKPQLRAVSDDEPFKMP